MAAAPLENVLFEILIDFLHAACTDERVDMANTTPQLIEDQAGTGEPAAKLLGQAARAKTFSNASGPTHSPRF